MVTCDKFVVGAAVCRAHPADVRESSNTVVERAHIGHHMAPRSFCKIAGQRIYPVNATAAANTEVSHEG